MNELNIFLKEEDNFNFLDKRKILFDLNKL